MIVREYNAGEREPPARDGPVIRLSRVELPPLEIVPLDQQRQIHDVFLRNQSGILTDAECEQLAILQ
jgi:hypothetical protein